MNLYMKKLCEEMPYLLIKDCFTGEIEDHNDYKYTWITCNELPSGWQEHFINMCKEIREPLERDNLLDKFSFIQVKEKYNTMVCYYHNGNKEVDEIIDRYAHGATHICVECGEPATCFTKGYYSSFCDDCAERFKYTVYPLEEYSF